MSKNKEFSEHLKNLQDQASEIVSSIAKDAQAYEVYGRLSMRWIEHNTPPEYTGKCKINIDVNEYNAVKLMAGTIGGAILTCMDDMAPHLLNMKKRDPLIKQLDNVMETAAVVRDTTNKHSWLPKFEGKVVNVGLNVPPAIAKYIATLVDIDDVNRIREYDVRVVMQMASPDFWTGVSPMVMVANSPKHETELIIELTNRLVSGDAKLYLSALKNEAECYIREHIKMEPVNTEAAFKALKEELTNSEKVPERLLN